MLRVTVRASATPVVFRRPSTVPKAERSAEHVTTPPGCPVAGSPYGTTETMFCAGSERPPPVPVGRSLCGTA
jgi:hypothetical protein